MNSESLNRIKVGARNSPLSQIQTAEVLNELKTYYPHVQFDYLFVASQGDKDLKTSLRGLEKTNFFTKEIDDLVLQGECRIGIHSAKDLPEPLPPGLTVAALTQGLDPADVLVMRKGETFQKLPLGAIIATSSIRREEMVKQMRPDFKFIDLRGTIAQRLSKLEERTADGVVVAEAALIRLGLTHLNRVVIPGMTAPQQGQLALVARSNDLSILNFFRCLDSRIKASKKILYLGLNLPARTDVRLIHYPIIKIVPKPINDSAITKIFSELLNFTHLIFTSQSAVSIFFTYLNQFSQKLSKCLSIIAVGKATAKKVTDYGASVQICAEEESAEGLLKELDKINLRNANVLWPRSSLSRDVIRKYFYEKQIRLDACVFYETHVNTYHPLPNLDVMDEIVFTSPSTINAFIQIFGEIPMKKALTCIGPITESFLKASKIQNF